MNIIIKTEQEIQELKHKKQQIQAEIQEQERELGVLKSELSEATFNNLDNTELLEKIDQQEKTINNQSRILESLTTNALKNKLPAVMEAVEAELKDTKNKVRATFLKVQDLKVEYNKAIDDINQERTKLTSKAIQNYAVAERIFEQLGTKEQQIQLKRLSPRSIYQGFDLTKIQMRGFIK